MRNILILCIFSFLPYIIMLTIFHRKNIKLPTKFENKIFIIIMIIIILTTKGPWFADICYAWAGLNCSDYYLTKYQTRKKNTGPPQALLFFKL